MEHKPPQATTSHMSHPNLSCHKPGVKHYQLTFDGLSSSSAFLSLGVHAHYSCSQCWILAPQASGLQHWGTPDRPRARCDTRTTTSVCRGGN